MLSKSLLSAFLSTEPMSEDMFTDKYKREAEFTNVIRLMNMLHKLALSAWNPVAPPNDLSQNRLNRIFSSKSMMAWSELLKDAVCAKLDIHDSDEKARPFNREFAESDFAKIEMCISRLLGWQLWSLPPNSAIDTQIASNKSALKEWFREKGLTTGFLMGAPE